MLPPHWLCKYCGMIITDSGQEPNPCSYCSHSGFQYLGYEGDYDGIDVRAQIGVLFDPNKFSPEMNAHYWRGMSENEKFVHQRKIDELNDKIRARMEEMGYIGNLFD